MDILNKYSYIGEGHQQPGRDPSNLYINFVNTAVDSSSPDFKVAERYTRMKNDLLYKHKITLQDALQCSPVKIPLLDGRQILLAIDQIITPKTIKKIEGEGMKHYNLKDPMDDHYKRGDLYI